MLSSGVRVERGYDTERFICFPIPSGGKTVAIVEFVFCGLCFLLLILSFVGNSIASGVFGILFIVGLVISAFFLLKSVNDGNALFTIPYIIVKLIHLVCQAILFILLIVAVATLSTVTASQTSFRDNSDTVAHIGMAVGILGLLFHLSWFVFGIIAVIVAFKVRNYFNAFGTPQPLGGMVIARPVVVHTETEREMRPPHYTHHNAPYHHQEQAPFSYTHGGYAKQ